MNEKDTSKKIMQFKDHLQSSLWGYSSEWKIFVSSPGGEKSTTYYAENYNFLRQTMMKLQLSMRKCAVWNMFVDIVVVFYAK